MKQRLGVPKTRASVLPPTVTIKAKDLATEMTNLTVCNTNISGESLDLGRACKNQ